MLGGFEGMCIPGEYCKMVQFGVYFDTNLPQKILEIFTYCIKIIILWPSHCEGIRKKLDGAFWSISY